MLRSTKIIITIGCILFVIILVNTFTTHYVGAKNTVITEGHFSSMKNIYYKGGYTYEIYITETNKPFITGDYSSHCFAYDALKASIKKGDPIKIYTCKNSYFTNPELVGLVEGKWQYMLLDCVNKQVDKDKITIPLVSAFGVALVAAVLINLIVKIKKLQGQ